MDNLVKLCYNLHITTTKENMASLIYIGRNIWTKEECLHTNNYWSFCYCLSGEAVMFDIKGNAYKALSNQILIIPPNVSHITNYSEDFCNIYFAIDRCDCFVGEDYVVKDNQQRDLQGLCEMTARLVNAQMGEDRKLENCLIGAIVAMLDKLRSSEGISSYVQTISDCITSNFNDKAFSLEKMFNQFELSNDYLRRQFIKEMGISPLQFLNNARIEFSKRLLSSKKINNYKICDIALLSGFDDQLYFSRVFRKTTGMSPKQYVEKSK